MSESLIKQYYNNKSILITGATGFCGKVRHAFLGYVDKLYFK